MIELIINKEKTLENILLAENGKLLEAYTSDKEDKKRRLEGNIYVGFVGDIIKGMQSAFVDLSLERKGFIHLKDAIPQVDETKEQIDRSLDIRQILKPKQKLLIQVKKDSDDKKGARVSTHISIPGKFIVLMPNTGFITISKKIEDENKKKNLIKSVKEILPDGFGAVKRTSAEKASIDEIKNDTTKLLNTWKQ